MPEAPGLPHSDPQVAPESLWDLMLAWTDEPPAPSIWPNACLEARYFVIYSDCLDTLTTDPPGGGLPGGRTVRMRRYFDTLLGQEMLLRIVVEESDEKIVVVTAYKTSQIQRYLQQAP